MKQINILFFCLILFFSCTQESEEKKKENIVDKPSVDTVAGTIDTTKEILAEPITKNAVYDIKSGIITYESELEGKTDLPQNKVVLSFSRYGNRQRIDYYEGLDGKIISSDVFSDSVRYTLDHRKKIVKEVQSTPEMFLFTPIYNGMPYTRKSALEDTVAGKRCEIYLWELPDIKFTLKRCGWKSICLLHQWTQEGDSKMMKAVKVDQAEVPDDIFKFPDNYKIKTKLKK
ncbi:MAG: hypothetical protein K2X86_06705 [Cytophagaceae bacterium]|nr:hypothetical protein [Cytophagaceae bacterium]